MKKIVFAVFVLSFICRLSIANTVYPNGSFTVNGASYLRQTLSGGHATGGVFSASRSTVTFVPAM
ncbi:MAG: hypothetical protein LBB93_06105, partial [Elusimicrobiota bacterium]|nr:hypothetical protein [Elusimicrobiota bacterium]